jgi:hypothetical protein
MPLLPSSDIFARPGWTVVLSDNEQGERWDLDRRIVWINPNGDPTAAKAHVAARIDYGHWLCAPHGRFSPKQNAEAREWSDCMLAYAEQASA